MLPLTVGRALMVVTAMGYANNQINMVLSKAAIRKTWSEVDSEELVLIANSKQRN